MKVYLLLFSLFKSFKAYIFFHIVLLSILIYMLFSIKLFDTIYSAFISYKYGFVPDVAVFVDKEQDIRSIIKYINKKNINFSYKMGAIKKLTNINFINKDYKSLSMNIELMGLYFDNDVYMNINNSKCLIVDIKNINRNWAFYLDKCQLPSSSNKSIIFETKYGKILFQITKRNNLYRLKTKNMSAKEEDILYKYLISIFDIFDDISHIGMKSSSEKDKKRILRDYLGLIFNNNSSFIGAIVSKSIYKEISWLKRKNVFVDININNSIQKLFVYNEFYSSLNMPILLTKFDPRIFGDDYTQFVYFYARDDRLLDFISIFKKKFPNGIIKTRNNLLGDNSNNRDMVKVLIIFFEFFIFIAALLISAIHLSKFYKKFQKTLFIVKSFAYKIYIYFLYLIIAVSISSILAYIFFYVTNEMINEYMYNYFYPSLNIFWANISYTIILILLFFVILFFLEKIEYKGLKNVH